MQSRGGPSRSTGAWPSYARRGEQAELAEWRRAAWNMFWLMVVGKLVIAIALAVVTFQLLHSAERSWRVIILMNWSWVLLTVVLPCGPAVYWFRMRRARRKRAALIRAEWVID